MFPVCLFTGGPPNWGWGTPGGTPSTGGVPPGVTPPNWGGTPGGTPQINLENIWDKKWTKFWTKNGQHFGPKIGQTFWKLLEVGGAGGTPLAVTQKDCLVTFAAGRDSIISLSFTIEFTLIVKQDNSQ